MLEPLTQQLFELQQAEEQIKKSQKIARELLIQECRYRNMGDKELFRWVDGCVGQFERYEVAKLVYTNCPPSVACTISDDKMAK